MKAIQVHQTGSPDVLKYEDIDKPVPKSGQVLVKVISVSVNWADVMLRKGTYPGMPPLPAVPGIDGAGVVESVGNEVTHVTPGQNVMIFGQKCYAQYTVTRAASVTPIPEGIDIDEAATLPVNYLTAYHMIHTMANIQPAQTILVYAAAGGVGTAVIQLGKLAGATIVGLTSSDEKCCASAALPPFPNTRILWPARSTCANLRPASRMRKASFSKKELLSARLSFTTSCICSMSTAGL